MIPMDGYICKPMLRSEWFIFNNVSRTIFVFTPVDVFTKKNCFPFHPLPFLHHKENVSDMYNHECVLYHCIMYDCIVGAGGAGRLLGTSDGNCARISEEREDSIRPVSASSAAGARLLPSAARDPHTSHWTWPLIRTSGTRPFEVPRSQF